MAASSKNSFYLIIILGLLIALGMCYFSKYQEQETKAKAQEEVAVLDSLLSEEDSQQEFESVSAVSQPDVEVLDLPLDATRVEDDLIDGGQLKGVLLGDIVAPVIIREFSSYTCGHCGAFHKQAFKQIKNTYLSSGKAKLIFSDFPLNKPALEASALTECLPEGAYASFQALLFENQEDWAYEEGYQTYLRQNAQLAGLDEETIETCLNDKDVQQSITENMRVAQDAYKVNSTPTFVIYREGQEADRTLISGSQSFETFQKVIEKYLNQE